MAAGTVVCGSMVVMQLLLGIDIKGKRKTNVRNSWDGRPLLLLKVQVGRFGAPGVGTRLWEGSPAWGLSCWVVLAMAGW